MGEWKLSKEEFERLEKKTVREVVERKFPDITGEEKIALCIFLRNYLINLWLKKEICI